ncbi:MAG: hypothetical protein KAI03_05000 [Candidatus Aureabacteria bacterium]|nr:hypothetical protein [Candidatus Auribacterota bacterium]
MKIINTLITALIIFSALITGTPLKSETSGETAYFSLEKARSLTSSKTLGFIFQQSISESLTSGENNTIFNKKVSKNAMQAINILSELIQKYPGISDFYSARAVAYALLPSITDAETGRKIRKKCLNDGRKALEINPENIEAHIALFFVDDDRTYLERALQIDPKNETANVYMCTSKYAFPALKGNSRNLTTEAIKELESLSDRYPDNIFILFLKGRLYLKNGNRQMAYKIFKKAYQLDPEQPAVTILLDALEKDPAQGNL